MMASPLSSSTDPRFTVPHSPASTNLVQEFAEYICSRINKIKTQKPVQADRENSTPSTLVRITQLGQEVMNTLLSGQEFPPIINNKPGPAADNRKVTRLAERIRHYCASEGVEISLLFMIAILKTKNSTLIKQSYPLFFAQSSRLSTAECKYFLSENYVELESIVGKSVRELTEVAMRTDFCKSKTTFLSQENIHKIFEYLIAYGVPFYQRDSERWEHQPLDFSKELHLKAVQYLFELRGDTCRENAQRPLNSLINQTDVNLFARMYNKGFIPSTTTFPGLVTYLLAQALKQRLLAPDQISEDLARKCIISSATQNTSIKQNTASGKARNSCRQNAATAYKRQPTKKGIPAQDRHAELLPHKLLILHAYILQDPKRLKAEPELRTQVLNVLNESQLKTTMGLYERIGVLYHLLTQHPEILAHQNQAIQLQKIALGLLERLPDPHPERHPALEKLKKDSNYKNLPCSNNEQEDEQPTLPTLPSQTPKENLFNFDNIDRSVGNPLGALFDQLEETNQGYKPGLLSLLEEEESKSATEKAKECSSPKVQKAVCGIEGLCSKAIDMVTEQAASAKQLHAVFAQLAEVKGFTPNEAFIQGLFKHFRAEYIDLALEIMERDLNRLAKKEKSEQLLAGYNQCGYSAVVIPAIPHMNKKQLNKLQAILKNAFFANFHELKNLYQNSLRKQSIQPSPAQSVVNASHSHALSLNQNKIKVIFNDYAPVIEGILEFYRNVSVMDPAGTHVLAERFPQLKQFFLKVENLSKKNNAALKRERSDQIRESCQAIDEIPFDEMTHERILKLVELCRSLFTETKDAALFESLITRVLQSAEKIAPQEQAAILKGTLGREPTLDLILSPMVDSCVQANPRDPRLMNTLIRLLSNLERNSNRNEKLAAHYAKLLPILNTCPQTEEDRQTLFHFVFFGQLKKTQFKELLESINEEQRSNLVELFANKKYDKDIHQAAPLSTHKILVRLIKKHLLTTKDFNAIRFDLIYSLFEIFLPKIAVTNEAFYMKSLTTFLSHFEKISLEHYQPNDPQANDPQQILNAADIDIYSVDRLKSIYKPNSEKKVERGFVNAKNIDLLLNCARLCLDQITLSRNGANSSAVQYSSASFYKTIAAQLIWPCIKCYQGDHNRLASLLYRLFDKPGLDAGVDIGYYRALALVRETVFSGNRTLVDLPFLEHMNEVVISFNSYFPNAFLSIDPSKVWSLQDMHRAAEEFVQAAHYLFYSMQLLHADSLDTLLRRYYDVLALTLNHCDPKQSSTWLLPFIISAYNMFKRSMNTQYACLEPSESNSPTLPQMQGSYVRKTLTLDYQMFFVMGRWLCHCINLLFEHQLEISPYKKDFIPILFQILEDVAFAPLNEKVFENVPIKEKESYIAECLLQFSWTSPIIHFDSKVPFMNALAKLQAQSGAITLDNICDAEPMDLKQEAFRVADHLMAHIALPPGILEKSQSENQKLKALIKLYERYPSPTLGNEICYWVRHDKSYKKEVDPPETIYPHLLTRHSSIVMRFHAQMLVKNLNKHRKKNDISQESYDKMIQRVIGSFEDYLCNNLTEISSCDPSTVHVNFITWDFYLVLLNLGFIVDSLAKHKQYHLIGQVGDLCNKMRGLLQHKITSSFIPKGDNYLKTLEKKVKLHLSTIPL